MSRRRRRCRRLWPGDKDCRAEQRVTTWALDGVPRNVPKIDSRVACTARPAPGGARAIMQFDHDD